MWRDKRPKVLRIRTYKMQNGRTSTNLQDVFFKIHWRCLRIQNYYRFQSITTFIFQAYKWTCSCESIESRWASGPTGRCVYDHRIYITILSGLQWKDISGSLSVTQMFLMSTGWSRHARNTKSLHVINLSALFNLLVLTKKKKKNCSFKLHLHHLENTEVAKSFFFLFPFLDLSKY